MVQEQVILFEDNHLIIVNKKAGEIVQGDKSGDTPLSEKIKCYIREKYAKPGEVFLGVIHRIDRPVSGIVMFARTGKALTRMNALFQEKKIEKKYWAVVCCKPESESGMLEGYLRKNEQQNKSYADSDETKGGKLSQIYYRLLDKSDNYFLLEVVPVTGRHHQIRALLAHAGMPIKGDLKYGAPRSNRNGSIHLHALEVKFVHPVKKETVQVICPPPDDPLWNFFCQRLHVHEK